jgi:CRISPR-associated endonuclease/helicase Cas3
MNVLLISQCDKRALTQTRRILDQFAERMGDRTWQTPITQAGLDTLKKLLRKTVRKNSAIACHWVRGKDHSELVWIVGDASRFNATGAVPTNTTTKDVLRTKSENNWRNGELISLLSAMASLMHDLGKSSVAFQEKLRSTSATPKLNVYRHEWVSLRLFQSFVTSCGQTDLEWLEALAAEPNGNDDKSEKLWLKNLLRDGIDEAAEANKPFVALNSCPLAMNIGWLIVSHHRLPQIDPPWGKSQLFRPHFINNWPAAFDAGWNGAVTDQGVNPKPFWKFSKQLPVSNLTWQRDASRVAKGLIRIVTSTGISFDGFLDPYVLHVSRLGLMLADHQYSSLNDSGGTKNPERVDMGTRENHPDSLYANTYGQGLNQPLDEHLVGVARLSRQVNWTLPFLAHNLARLSRSKALKKRSTEKAFQWQNKAFEVAEAVRVNSEKQGAFIINMASTGRGKTLANAKIMYALANPEIGMRCAFAMGLRTLTMQTGKSFQNLLSLGEDELAIRVGDSASRQLFERSLEEAELTGSESTQELHDETSQVLFEDNTSSNPVMQKLFKDQKSKAILQAPILVCTIDHLTPATEADRGGRQIVPMLRLMTSDLVLDEPDDFDVADFPALARLVNWAGLLGSKVLLSSATLPPALVQGLYAAYCDGRTHFINNRTDNAGGKEAAPTISCIWVDEYKATAHSCNSLDSFKAQHETFVNHRVTQLTKEPAQRKFELRTFTSNVKNANKDFAALALKTAHELHCLNAVLDVNTNKRVSFGLVRMANITPLFAVAIELYKSTPPDDTHIHLCTYHSQHPLIVRSEIEKRLDKCLDRKIDSAVFDIPEIREALQKHPAKNHIFIVLGSPVTEVGRDHDYDWAIVEPSSMRSIIQILGRIRRHRRNDVAWNKTNVVLLSTNLKHIRNPNGTAFTRPGFEVEEVEDFDKFTLDSHDLNVLLPQNLEGKLNATPRINSEPRKEDEHKSSLIGLEHARLEGAFAETCASHYEIAYHAAAWWTSGSQSQLTALLLIKQPFRKATGADLDAYLKPDDEGGYEFVSLTSQGKGKDSIQRTINSQLLKLPECSVQNQSITPWCRIDYLSAIEDIAEEREILTSLAALRFGRITLRESDKKWRFHEVLGFVKAD